MGMAWETIFYSALDAWVITTSGALLVMLICGHKGIALEAMHATSVMRAITVI